MNNLFKSTPIVSRYVSFYSRDIIYERFGKRKVKRVSRLFGQPFPIQTDMIDKKTFDKIANGAKYTRVGELILI